MPNANALISAGGGNATCGGFRTGSSVLSALKQALAVIAAGYDRRLRILGITVRKTIDLIIGAFCCTRGHALLTADQDFTPMARHLGLALV